MQATRRGNRSSLPHNFPSFYACYLLKSIQTPSSKATYIGSTPNPPRRIRQHNGELVQGARKTRSRRPWVMQMIVHGFPSRLAALQFEWAWQHPQRSRHLRGEDGQVIFPNSGRGLTQNIQILRYMISNHPYNTWPLHVKIFTPEALKCWDTLSGKQTKSSGALSKDKGKAVSTSSRKKATVAVSTNTLALPQGFTYTVELEGVDGKSGHFGSGRVGPLEVNDEQFTSMYLQKYSVMLAANPQLHCMICKEPLTDFTKEPLTHSLCPHRACTGVAHLLCLSAHFLSQSKPAQSLTIVPRGGNCPSCSTYVLWGDVVRGAYRRAAGGAVSVSDDEHEDDEAFFVSDSLPEDDDEKTSSKTKKQGGKRKAKVPESPRKRRARNASTSSSSGGEEFDFGEVDDVQFSDDSLRRTKKRSPRKEKVPVSATSSTRKSKPVKSRTRTKNRESSEGELFDFDAIDDVTSSDSGLSKRKAKRVVSKVAVSDEGNAISSPSSAKKRGRPPKIAIESSLLKTSSSSAVHSVSPPSPAKRRGRPPKVAIEPSLLKPTSSSAKMPPLKKSTKRRYHTGVHQSDDSSSGEIFDFDAVSDSDAEKISRKTIIPSTRSSPFKGVTGVQPVVEMDVHDVILTAMDTGSDYSEAMDEDAVVPHNDLLRSMSSLSIHSPGTSPRAMAVIELSD